MAEDPPNPPFSRLLRSNVPSRIFAGLLVAAAGITLLTQLSRQMYGNLDTPWTSVRLAPTFALWQGYPLYSTATQPPWVMIGYGPLYPLMYTPCLLAATPAPAVAIATILACLFILVPVLFLIRLACGGTMPWVQAAAATLMVYPTFALVPSLNNVILTVKADAPALGLLLLGAAFLLRLATVERPSLLRGAGLAGLCLGMAMACKANLAPAILVFLGWCYWLHGWRAAAFLASACGMAVLGLYGAACLANDPRAILLNFQVLGAFPWVEWTGSRVTAPTAKIRILIYAVRRMAMEAGPASLAIAITLRKTLGGLAAKRHPEKPASLLAAFFLLLAFALLLPAAASVSKFGGDFNSWALFTLPITLAGVFAIGHLEAGAMKISHPFFMLLCLPGILVGLQESRSFRPARLIAAIPSAALVQSYRIAEQGKHACYLPFDPLAHLLAGGPFLPNFDAVYCYRVGGRPLDPKAFAAALPVGLDRVYLDKSMSFWGREELERLLPAFALDSASGAAGRYLVFAPAGGLNGHPTASPSAP